MDVHIGTATIPAHIPRDRVVDYDMFADARYLRTGDIHQGIHLLGEEKGRGIFWTPFNGGHWLINSHELLFEAARDPSLFSNEDRAAQPGGMVMIPAMADGSAPRFAPQSLDPPEHGIYRLPLMKVFSPTAIAHMERGIRELAGELIEALRPRGKGEFIDAVGEPLPVTVFLKMMGMPLERIGDFRSWMAMFVSDDDDQRDQAFANIAETMGTLIAARQVKREPDLISRLLDIEIDGKPPTMRDMQSVSLLLFTAGLDTLVNAFTYGMFQLSRTPALQERIRADRALIPEFIEETLRRYGVTMPPRLVARDAEFGGVQIKAGERVMLMLPGANLDPDAYPDPLIFDIDRENKAHLAFNAGPHRCVGSHLARLEMRVFYEEWFARMPNIYPDPEDRPTYRPGLNLAICKLPLVWDAVG